MIRSVAILLATLGLGCGSPPAPAPEPGPATAAPAAAPAEPGPRRSAALDRLLGDALGNWVVELNNGDGAALDPLSPPAPAAPEELPAVAAERLEHVLAAAVRARLAAETELDARASELDAAVADFDRALLEAGLGYAIDASVLSPGGSGDGGDRVVLLFSFTIDRVRRFRSGDGRELRALWARRLDALAFRYRLIGLAGEDRDPLILLGPIEELLCRELLPAIADPGSWVRPREGASPRIGDAVAAALRADLSPAVGPSRLGPLGRHLGRRRAVFEGIAARLAERGVGLEPPSTLRMEGPWRQMLAPVATAEELAELATIEEALAAPANQIGFAEARELAIAAVEHHELQHRIDLGRERAAPAALAAQPSSIAAPVTSEASAYLAQIARHPAGARLSVVQLGGFVLGSAPAVERRVAEAILVALAGELGVPVDPAPRPPEAMGAALSALLAMDGRSLAGAAAAVWAAWFGGPLETLTPLP